MKVFIRSSKAAALFLILIIVGAASLRPGFGQGQERKEDKARQAPIASPILAVLPQGDLEIVYVESKHGMTLIVKSHDGSIQAQRIWLGDGKAAVMFEATNNGFRTPKGRVNAASLAYEEASTLTFPRHAKSVWGAKRGEVYVRVPGLKFQFE